MTCIPATTAMADIAFVSDMSGVCSSGETRRITSSPKNVDRRKTKSFASRLTMGALGHEVLGRMRCPLKHAGARCATGLRWGWADQEGGRTACFAAQCERGRAVTGRPQAVAHWMSHTE